jgi:hypothetical protein
MIKVNKINIIRSETRLNSIGEPRICDIIAVN